MKVNLKKLAALAVAALMGVSASAYGQLVGGQLSSDMDYTVSDAEATVVPAGMILGGCDSCGAKGGCDDGCGTHGKNGGNGKGCGYSCYLFGPDEPIELFSGIGGCSGIDVGGWVQVGYHTEGANDDGTGLFNNFPNEFQAHQLWAYLEKTPDGSCGPDWGFRIDYVYGTDGQDTQAFGNALANGEQGWDNEWDNGPPNGYGHAIPQAYLQLAVNDLTITAGHFYTIIGYEVVTAPDNFFYSHAVTMVTNEPFTHTGVLAEYAVNDCTTIWGGWTLGWDTGFDSDGGSTFLGGISRQLRDDLTMTSAVIVGDFGFATSGGGSDADAYMTSTVIDWVISDIWEYVLQYDFQDNQTSLAPVGQAHAVNNYLFYTVNDCLRFGIRGEWAKIGPAEQSEITFGMNYRPHANVVLRPEVRWDMYNFVQGAPANVPGNRQDTVLFGVDCVVTW